MSLTFEQRLEHEKRTRDLLLTSKPDEIKESMSPGEVDQLEAAERETASLRGVVGEAFVGRIAFVAHDEEILEQHLDALAGMCVAFIHNTRWHCPHANPQAAMSAPRPLIASLGFRVMSCERCLNDAMMNLSPHMGCDICEEIPEDGVFADQALQVGPVLVIGSIGSCCGKRLSFPCF